MTTRVVHVNDPIPGSVYIGRQNGRRKLKRSIFANPFVIGDTLPGFEGGQLNGASRADVIAMYALDITTTRRHLLADLPQLRDKPLACWCRYDGERRIDRNTCHGDVLVYLLNTYTDDELKRMAER